MENSEESSDEQIYPQSCRRIETMDAIGSSSSSSSLLISEGDMPDLPPDIIAEILVRLSVKPLLKFKCVAKSWLSLISSPRFIKNHVRHSPMSSANYRLMLGISYDGFHEGVKNDDSVSYLVRDLLAGVVIQGGSDWPPNNFTGWDCQITGSCNGLLCITAHLRRHHPSHHLAVGGTERTFLWNPCLKMSKEFPPLAAPAAGKLFRSSTYGIGYDEANDDYKVVGLLHVACNDGDTVDIYVLKKKDDDDVDDSWWRRIGGFSGAIRKKLTYMMFAKGKLAFLSRLTDTGRFTIVSLDLENEVYLTTETPQPLRADVFLGVTKGCLSVLYDYKLVYMDVWILKEYGVKESWTKLIRIPYVDGPYSSINNNRPYYLCISLNGKFLLARGSQLVVYDPQDESIVYPRKGPINSMTSSTAIYLESLVPPTACCGF